MAKKISLFYTVRAPFGARGRAFRKISQWYSFEGQNFYYAEAA